MEERPYLEADGRSVFEQVPPKCILPFSEEPTEYTRIQTRWTLHV